MVDRLTAARWPMRAIALLALLMAGLLGAPAGALARAGGFVGESCSGCHQGGESPDVGITASVDRVAPGQVVRLSVTIAAINGTTGGLSLQATPGVGTLSTVTRSTKLGSNAVTHSAPQAAVAGVVTFQADWTAPDRPSDVSFVVNAVSANADRRSGGDGAGRAYLALAVGCDGVRYYPDFDSDGFGNDSGDYRVACAMPDGYAARGSDCDDNDAAVQPEASEVCNLRDDDCDGLVDEDQELQTFCTDGDRDGHGVAAQKSVRACMAPAGFGACDDDCKDSDPTVYPDALELCNERDDNCNGRVDENARLTCGIGWCRRYAESCTSFLCRPGEPRDESCNGLDDDCDGVTDNGADLCGPDASCLEGLCTPVAGPVGSRPDATISNDAGRAPDRAAPDAATEPEPEPSEPEPEPASESGQAARDGCNMQAGRARGPSKLLAMITVLLLVYRRRRREPEDRSAARERRTETDNDAP